MTRKYRILFSSGTIMETEISEECLKKLIEAMKNLSADSVAIATMSEKTAGNWPLRLDHVDAISPIFSE